MNFSPSTARTDRNHNPLAFTTAIAKQAGLQENIDYKQGDPFTDNGETFYTAHLLRDPVALCVHVIDAISFYTQHGALRWNYIAIPNFIWRTLPLPKKVQVIGSMYIREGGTEMAGLFPN